MKVRYHYNNNSISLRKRKLLGRKGHREIGILENSSTRVWPSGGIAERDRWTSMTGYGRGNDVDIYLTSIPSPRRSAQ